MTPYVIELALRSPAELFEPGEPPPLGPRALHPQVVDAIAQQWLRAPRGCSLQLRILLPAETLGETGQLTGAIRDYFLARSVAEQLEIRRVLRDGRITLIIGLVFLTLVNGIAELIRATIPGRFAGAVVAGLEIFGWVALWYPAELLLYAWLPAYRRVRLLRRLSEASIEFQAARL